MSFCKRNFDGDNESSLDSQNKKMKLTKDLILTWKNNKPFFADEYNQLQTLNIDYLQTLNTLVTTIDTLFSCAMPLEDKKVLANVFVNVGKKFIDSESSPPTLPAQNRQFYSNTYRENANAGSSRILERRRQNRMEPTKRTVSYFEGELALDEAYMATLKKIREGKKQKIQVFKDPSIDNTNVCSDENRSPGEASSSTSKVLQDKTLEHAEAHGLEEEEEENGVIVLSQLITRDDYKIQTPDTRRLKSAIKNKQITSRTKNVKFAYDHVRLFREWRYQDTESVPVFEESSDDDESLYYDALSEAPDQTDPSPVETVVDVENEKQSTSDVKKRKRTTTIKNDVKNDDKKDNKKDNKKVKKDRKRALSKY